LIILFIVGTLRDGFWEARRGDAHRPNEDEVGRPDPGTVLLLEGVPPEAEWFANIPTPNTRRAYRVDIDDFRAFAGIRTPADFRMIDRGHVIAWQEELVRRG
jgi:hypothetical protein